MSDNLAHPWILARLALSLSALTVAAISSVAAARVLAVPRESRPDARALAAERHNELAASALTLALAIELLAAAATVLAADRLSGSVRGAMCAYGVLATSPSGPLAVAASAAAALGAAAWLGARAVDRRIAVGSLSRSLARGALAVTALVALDGYASTRFFLGLDLRAHASCCSTSPTAAASIDPGARGLADPGALALVTSIAALGAAAMVAALRARPSPARGALAALTSLGASGLALWAGRDLVAPFAFESPAHRCAYCLLRAGEAGGAGPAFLISWALVSLAAAAAAGAAWVGRRRAARAASVEALAGLCAPWLALWATVAASALAPAVRYRITAGTFGLFGH